MTGMFDGDAQVEAEALEWYLRNREAAGAEAGREFMDWLRRSPGHVKAYLSLSVVGQDIAVVGQRLPLAHERQQPGEVRDGRAGNVVPLSRTRLPGQARPGTGKGVRHAAARRLAAAAAALFGLAIAGWAAWPGTMDISTGSSEQREVVLGDESRIHLDAGTELRVRMGWWKREVFLKDGHAAFEVAADRRPFLVHTGDLLLEDIGTTFDVLTVPSGTRIAVSDGRVKVWRDGAAASTGPLADLSAGDVLRLEHGSRHAVVVQQPAETMLDWRKGWIEFENERVEDVIARFNRFHDDKVRIMDHVAAERRISGRLRQYDIRDLVEFLSADPAITVEQAGREVLIGSRTAQYPTVQ